MLLKNGQKVDGKKDFLPMKKTAVFELTDRYSRTDPKSLRTQRASNLFIPATYTKFDKDLNDTVEIRYAESEIPKTDNKGNSYKKYTPDNIKIEKGIKWVPVTKPDLYTFLMGHPKLGKSFRLKDPAVNATKTVTDEAILFKAKSLIYGEPGTALKATTLRKILVSIGHPGVDDMTTDEIKAQLSIMATENPTDFINKCNSKNIDYEFMIMTASEGGKILSFNDDERKWIWGSEMGTSKGRTIVAVPVGREDIVAFFIDWLLRTDNTGVLNELQASTEKIKAKKPKAEAA